MLLGKRPRPPMKRTTSMSEITLDLNAPPPDPANSPNPNTQRQADAPRKQPVRANWLDQTANRTRNSADFIETAESDFLRACSLCKRRLVPGRDIYMYRGDSAFCSQECRQKQMIQDERKEKRCLASGKQAVAQPSGSRVTTTKGESVVAL
ncbi:FCS-Like Zinc finger 6-like [Senna tora]|uniref:FCS-Like Zinc finger 6-like n=1 Tax=Senna tora TaxID=362788 RepID=A0A834T7Y0_9FABA|nr:FCS-Like Zinc finger 6-like [Senna tora]